MSTAPPQAKQLLQLLETMDETEIVKQLKAARIKRIDSGKGDDLVEALSKAGLIVVHEKKPWESKKVWGGLLALGIALWAEATSNPDLFKAALPPLVYVFGQGIADLGKYKVTTKGD